ncbi:hypothetical protein Sru01_66000 [Sphaerisporangium rufum]|uniref:Uncharacterized protein n=1 Tax=Sphaerisporangium rufum TaxID=1381558 RepID=A0A919R9C4_9ACTN|nr:hypothetical protein [Sphaerisporangium rufum]GII81618.1 hypothetical protein Sru01_66000 [Sphaerisporangium rufum]
MTRDRLYDWDVYTGREPGRWSARGVTDDECRAADRISTAFAALPHGTCAWAEITRVRLDPACLAPRERVAGERRAAVRLWDGCVIWSLPRRLSRTSSRHPPGVRTRLAHRHPA